jgi:hypothetical protein
MDLNRAATGAAVHTEENEDDLRVFSFMYNFSVN